MGITTDDAPGASAIATAAATPSGPAGVDTEPPLPWELVDSAVFDELLAKIIVNPQTALDELPTPLVKSASDGSTLLHVITGWNNCQELVTQLLDAGIPPNVRDASGWTPLLEAAQEGQIEVCQVLLARGAIPDLAVNDITPLRAAAEVGNEEMTKWLLKQPGTWSGEWDSELFEFLLDKTPDAVATYLDSFATVLNHSKRGHIAVKYSHLRALYGEPSVPVESTALAMVVKSSNARDILSHRVIKYLMKAKWKAFAKTKFRREFSVYCTLLVAYYVPTIWADPDWIQLASALDYWVALSRVLSWICSGYLLFRVERNEFMGESAMGYFLSFWNWLNIGTYLAVVTTIPLEFVASLSQVRNSILALITVSLWLNLLQFLQMSTESGLLIAMMSHMVKDVYRFLLLYAVFLFGFSGAFYTLLRGSTGYENFTNSFITVFLMLYGQVTFDTFNATKGWVWHTSVGLLLIHLMCVVIVLLNILIAMMATTYSDVWESAEAEALQSHAQAIIRMEKSLLTKERKLAFEKLLTASARRGITKAASARAAKNASTVVAQHAEGSPADILTRRSSAKRTLRAGITEKLKALPIPGEARQAVQKALRFRRGTGKGAIHASMSLPGDLVSSPTRKEAKHSTTFIEALIETPNLQLTALEESLFLKSALDQDDDDSPHGSLQNRLAVLEDGIRYELPVKKSKDKHDEDTIADLQAQVQQLSKAMADIQSFIQEERANALRPAGSSTSRRQFDAYNIPRM
uniref:Ion transport domain-containing protein n=1 Tax=Globisporangium ultimum (strain ATCC 200006 / CBS 805.95 / DAOM BR144) TaxID=431595 RepID=K3X141_GLOUD